MENHEDSNYRSIEFVEDGIRKSSYDRPAIVLINLGIHSWIPCKTVQTCFKAAQEFFSESWPAALISFISVCKIIFGFLRKANFSVHDDFGLEFGLRPIREWMLELQLIFASLHQVQPFASRE